MSSSTVNKLFFGTMVWLFVILIRLWALTQLLQMNSEHSVHHETAKASSSQFLHLTSNKAASSIDLIV